MKLVIAGSRNFRQISRFSLEQLISFYDLWNIKEIISGGCPTGPDNAAFWHAKHNNINFKEFSAEWEKYGNRAGPIRNKKMAVYGDALLLIWDGESKGSQSMKNAMMELKKPIYEVILRCHNEPNENNS